MQAQQGDRPNSGEVKRAYTQPWQQREVLRTMHFKCQANSERQSPSARTHLPCSLRQTWLGMRQTRPGGRCDARRSAALQ